MIVPAFVLKLCTPRRYFDRKPNCKNQIFVFKSKVLGLIV